MIIEGCDTALHTEFFQQFNKNSSLVHHVIQSVLIIGWRMNYAIPLYKFHKFHAWSISVLSIVHYKQFFNPWRDSVGLYRLLKNQLCNTAIYTNFMLKEFQFFQHVNINISLILIVSWWQKSKLCNSAM